MTTLVIGAGAVGCTLACKLIRAGHSVSFLVRAQQVEAYSRITTLTVDNTVSGELLSCARPAIVSDLPNSALDRVIVATKNNALPDVIKALDGLPNQVPIITALNGVSHLAELQNAFPQNPVHAITLMFNTQLLAPMRSNLNTLPVVQVAEGQLRGLLSESGFVTEGWDLASFNGKLVLNVVNATGALTGKALNAAMDDPQLAPCFVAAIVEAGRCLNAAGLPFTMAGALAFEDYERLQDEPAAGTQRILPASSQAAAPLKASMIADIERGRDTEIDQLNGEIVRIGLSCGFPTPINQALVTLVKALSAGQISQLSTAQLRCELGIV